MRSSVFFSHKCGQLGNRLFAFAHLIANASENNYTVVNLAFDEYAKYFQSTSQDIFCRYPIKETKLKSNRIRSLLFQINRGVLKFLRISSLTKNSFYEVIVADLPEYQFHRGKYYHLQSEEFKMSLKNKKWILLFGRFFRDYSGIVNHQNKIREFFTPTLDIRQRVSEVLTKVKVGADLVIGVHIRGGDYREYAGGKFFFKQEEYCRKMLELQEIESERKINFVICSNENIDMDLFKQLSCIKGPGHLVEDMYVFAGCDFLIGPPSTYTRWASFYGNVPLLQLESLDVSVRIENFSVLPPERLFDF